MVAIRTAEPSDLEAIAAIYNALLAVTTYEWTESPHSVDELSKWLQSQRASDRPVLVAVDAGRVVGWTTYGDFRDSSRWPGYRFTVEHSIHVAPTHWRRGIGRMLLERLMDEAVLRGKRTIVAGIDSSNRQSVTFHERLGFRQVAYMAGIGDKWDQRLDLILMQRELDEPSA